MRNKVKNIYEKDNKSLNCIYIVLKILFIFSGKYKQYKIETNLAIDNFEPKNIKKSERKKIFKKLIVYRYIYYIRASEYYLYDFEKNDNNIKKTFMTREMTNKYYSVINAEKFRKVFDKKNLCYKVFEKYYKRDMVCVGNTSDKDKKIFKEFIKNKDKFILKPLSGHSGEGVKIIDTKDFSNFDELFSYTLEFIPYIVEELINQDSGLGVFHPSSVNTVRIVTFTYGEDVSILWAFLRTGCGDSSVDNMGSEGLGALIDSKNGKIISDGVNWKGEKVKNHPDSKITFKAYQIPRWNEAIKTVMELAGEIKEMHCVGWDLSLTANGWVLVEGNARPQCVTIQTFTKKGYKPYYDKMYKLVKKDKDNELKLLKGEII